MNLLMLKRLTLHFTNQLVNDVALKSNFMQFKLLKVETQSVQVC